MILAVITSQNTKIYFAFCDTIPAISVQLKRSLTHKVTFNLKSIPTLPNLKEPSIISYKKGKSSKDLPVRAKL